MKLKKLISRLFLAALGVCVIFTATACDVDDVQKFIDDNTSVLDKPVNVRFDEENVLRWDSVKGATSYNVIIDNVVYSAQAPAFDLKNTNIANGKHEA